MSNTHKSPLRYPGGKSKISAFIEDLLLLNNLENCTVYELYAGGAGASLDILFSGICKRIVLNDLDYHIYSLWYSILNKTDDFVKLINKTGVDIPNWDKQKEVYLNYQKYDILEVGFSAFFLNRCNRSGIFNAGPIGGKDQMGNYKIGVRFNKSELIERIYRIAQKRDQIEIMNLEAIDLLKTIFKISGNIFVFLDPPYFVQGENLYFNFYNEEDHKELSKILKNNNTANWLLTYDNCEKIKNFYSGCKKADLPMTYTLQEKKKSKEIMIFSQKLVIPSILKMGSKRSNLKLIESS